MNNFSTNSPRFFGIKELLGSIIVTPPLPLIYVGPFDPNSNLFLARRIILAALILTVSFASMAILLSI